MSQVVRTTDGQCFESTKVKLVGSVKKVKDRDVNQPAVIGEYPVFVEQSGSYRLFTYSRKIQSIETEVSDNP